MESRQNTTCVIVIEELTSELKIQLIAKFLDTFLNLLGLNLQIFIIKDIYFSDKGYAELFTECRSFPCWK